MLEPCAAAVLRLVRAGPFVMAVKSGARSPSTHCIRGAPKIGQVVRYRIKRPRHKTTLVALPCLELGDTVVQRDAHELRSHQS